MTGHETTRGLLFVASGRAHAEAASRARASFRDHAPDLQACLFTDVPEAAEGFEILREVPDAHRRSKVDCMPLTPFDRTLYVDTDTLALAEVTPVFDLLDRFDMAAAHVATWSRPSQNRSWEGGVPYVFPQVNSGVLLYRSDGAAMRLLENWREAYHRAREEAGIGTDQATLREQLWQAQDLKLYILPPQWNKRMFEASELIYSDQPRPIIVHVLGLRPPKTAWQRLVRGAITRLAPRRWRHRGPLGPDER
ncbi:glycosyltransferase family protein [Histidinibacterium aquaticum]|uniref:Nucleotide-diphospho-sugar transferase domain-containing protein n=1 Tax=Histidinibacterium aquaticum TaxID=2613962 RepID=A0A5J5GIW9_9RHOB|nr:hypothetical protein [Histidinibacterium aquaticum]KAA9008176.1 hypothetical protein F3S47_11800 [Histidinibacterium aquaticum]